MGREESHVAFRNSNHFVISLVHDKHPKESVKKKIEYYTC